MPFKNLYKLSKEEYDVARFVYGYVYRKMLPERNAANTRKQTRKRRERALAAYGSVCACCGEGRYEFLALDHINGGGNKHRKETGCYGTRFVTWLIVNKFPPIMRVLCHNCNMALGNYGHCPHVKENVESTNLSI